MSATKYFIFERALYTLTCRAAVDLSGSLGQLLLLLRTIPSRSTTVYFLIGKPAEMLSGNKMNEIIDSFGIFLVHKVVTKATLS